MSEYRSQKSGKNHKGRGFLTSYKIFQMLDLRMNKIKSHEDLLIWQKSIELNLQIYQQTTSFPSHELFGMVSQIRRASTSIASNIAEGFGRKSRVDFKRFLRISMGSLNEVKTQLFLSSKLGYLNEEDRYKLHQLAEEISKMMHSILNRP